MLLAKKIKIPFLFFFVFGAFSCQKNPQQVSNNNIPYVAINLNIYPNDAQYFKIQTPGGWVYYNGAGVRGLIIYRKTTTDFVVLDRASTYYPNDPAALAKVQSDSFTCKDTVSGSSWQIFDGAVITGPATYALRPYQSTYDGNVLKIIN